MDDPDYEELYVNHMAEHIRQTQKDLNAALRALTSIQPFNSRGLSRLARAERLVTLARDGLAGVLDDMQRQPKLYVCSES
jgi:hypothetical protein